MSRIVILGGGFGGLTVATNLRQALGSEHEVVVIDRARDFLMGLRKPWAVAGVASLEGGRRSRALLRDRGINFVEASISEIDPVGKIVDTSRGRFEADFVVVALGAEPRGDLVPGFDDNAHNLYRLQSIPALSEAVDGFGGGRIVIAIAGTPYKCPPAPFETAFLLDDHLRVRGLRDATELNVVTLQPILLPNAGKEGSEWLGRLLESRGIGFLTGARIEGIEPGRLVFADSQAGYDLLIGVPPHRAPPVVRESGLIGEGEWITVDPRTFATSYDGVFAVGDVVGVELANGLPLPKAGLFAELQGNCVAARIVARITGSSATPEFEGRGFCFIETSKDTAALVEGEFYETPAPVITVADIAPEHAAAKKRFEAERLEKWFGSRAGASTGIVR